jgi:zinc D-Ala-D-Ala carboxypeptidase
MNWEKYINFKKSEFDCKHTGLNEMKPEFMDLLQTLRTRYGKSMRITSGYRHKSHPVERNKTISGAHQTGLACDIAVERGDAFELLKLALELGFTGIGIQQKGSGRFIHLDIIKSNRDQPRPLVWSY